MSISWNWPKATALLTAQAGAQTAIGLLVGKDFLQLDWTQVGGSAGLSALVAFLGAVVAYKLPSSVGTALVSAPISAAQDAAEGVETARALAVDTASGVVPPVAPPPDNQARGW